MLLPLSSSLPPLSLLAIAFTSLAARFALPETFQPQDATRSSALPKHASVIRVAKTRRGKKRSFERFFFALPLSLFHSPTVPESIDAHCSSPPVMALRRQSPAIVPHLVPFSISHPAFPSQSPNAVPRFAFPFLSRLPEEHKGPFRLYSFLLIHKFKRLSKNARPSASGFLCC